MNACDFQPVILASAGLIVAATPGIVAVIVALGNRQQIARIPGKRASDGADLAEIRRQLAALVAQIPGNGGGGSNDSTP